MYFLRLLSSHKAELSICNKDCISYWTYNIYDLGFSKMVADSWPSHTPFHVLGTEAGTIFLNKHFMVRLIIWQPKNITIVLIVGNNP